MTSACRFWARMALTRLRGTTAVSERFGAGRCCSAATIDANSASTARPCHRIARTSSCRADGVSGCLLAKVSSRPDTNKDEFALYSIGTSVLDGYPLSCRRS